MTITNEPIEHCTISDADFYEHFAPVKNHLNPDAPFDGCMFETFGEELDFVRAQDPALVWTIIDCDGTMTIESGYHFVNRLGYLVASSPRPDDCIYSVTDDDTPRHYLTLTAEEARAWLLANDREGAALWSSSDLPAHHLIEAVGDNLRDFGDFGNLTAEKPASAVTLPTPHRHETVTISRRHLMVILDYLRESEADHYEETVESYPEAAVNHVYSHVLAIEAQLTDAEKGGAK